jgi:hypothetical protein
MQAENSLWISRQEARWLRLFLSALFFGHAVMQTILYGSDPVNSSIKWLWLAVITTFAGLWVLEICILSIIDLGLPISPSQSSSQSSANQLRIHMDQDQDHQQSTMKQNQYLPPYTPRNASFGGQPQHQRVGSNAQEKMLLPTVYQNDPSSTLNKIAEASNSFKLTHAVSRPNSQKFNYTTGLNV